MIEGAERPDGAMLMRWYLRPLGRSMPVNDDLAEIGGAAQKLVPDPSSRAGTLRRKASSRGGRRGVQPVMLDAAVPSKTVSRSLLWFARNHS
jgi:hypothetical protein